FGRVEPAARGAARVLCLGKSRRVAGHDLAGRRRGPILIYLHLLLLFGIFHAIVGLRLLLLYRLAVAKRSRVKLAAFFCARLQDFRVSSSELHRQTQKTAKDGLSSGTVVRSTAQLWVCFQPLNPGSGSRSTR